MSLLAKSPHLAGNSVRHVASIYPASLLPSHSVTQSPESDTWDMLKPYTGRPLIGAAENDRVIPGEVMQWIDTALRASSSEHLKQALGLITMTLRMVV